MNKSLFFVKQTHTYAGPGTRRLVYGVFVIEPDGKKGLVLVAHTRARANVLRDRCAALYA